MDETVVMGGAPFQFLGYPKKLREDYNVRGVINMCEEYKGPLREYRELGMEELHLPTTDHFEPSYEDLLVSRAERCLLNSLMMPTDFVLALLISRVQWLSFSDIRRMATRCMFIAARDMGVVQPLCMRGVCIKIQWQRCKLLIIN